MNRRTSSIIRVPLSAQVALNFACSSGGRSIVSRATCPPAARDAADLRGRRVLPARHPLVELRAAVRRAAAS